ncbi:discoidin domain-containing protein, partial [Paenibacillus elgii]|uniref:discoidin domain-containing protein n=1 Tax=Paenibacillus elgii TaxID=189691 RepID=UPI00203BF542
MAVIITSNKSVDFNQGIKTNVEMVDGKLQLIVTGQTPLPSSANIIPAMTSNTSPSGVASASSSQSGQPAYTAFNRTDSMGWRSGSGSAFPQWISYEFPSNKAITRYTLKPSSIPSEMPKTWTFEGSIDGSIWNVLDTQTNQINWTSSEVRTFNVSNNTAFKVYRFRITANNGGSLVGINKIEMMQSELTNIYPDSGTFESTLLDLGQYFRQIKSISAIKGIPTGTEVKVYTSTSNDNMTFSTYSLVNANGLITSPQARFIKIKVEMIGKTETQTVTLNSFTSEESSKFKTDEQLLFDKGLQLKTIYQDQLLTDQTWTDVGKLFRKQLNKNQFIQIDKIEV